MYECSNGRFEASLPLLLAALLLNFECITQIKLIYIIETWTGIPYITGRPRRSSASAAIWHVIDPSLVSICNAQTRQGHYLLPS